MEEEQIEVQEQSPALVFLKIYASFKDTGDGDQLDIDYDALGIKPPPTGHIYSPAYLNISRIESIFENSIGGLNYVMSSGDSFSGRPEDNAAVVSVLDVLSLSIKNDA